VGFGDARQGEQPGSTWRRAVRAFSWCGEVDLGETAEGAVVHDVGVGDGQDDPEAGAEAGVQFGLEVDDVGEPSALLLGIHAVIGGDADDSAEGQQAADLKRRCPRRSRGLRDPPARTCAA
jgi:hypothetical protein